MRASILKNIFIVFAFTVLATDVAFAQGSGFNFQGRLNDGANPANGQYDLQFRLYNGVTGGTQIGGTVSRPATVLINGVFSTTLDFGATAFVNPNNVFIEIAVKPAASPNAYTILGPRQQLTVVPFAGRAANASNADFATNATNATNAESATTAVIANTATTASNALNLGGVAPSGYAKLNVINTGDLRTTGSLAITGDAFQPATARGFVKAMLEISDFGTIVRCYNGVTNSSTGNCGFVLTMPSGTSGIYRINFGFPISSNFVSATARYEGIGGGNNNSGVNYRGFDNTSIEFFTYTPNIPEDTVTKFFTVILF